MSTATARVLPNPACAFCAQPVDGSRHFVTVYPSHDSDALAHLACAEACQLCGDPVVGAKIQDVQAMRVTHGSCEAELPQPACVDCGWQDCDCGLGNGRGI